MKKVGGFDPTHPFFKKKVGKKNPPYPIFKKKWLNFRNQPQILGEITGLRLKDYKNEYTGRPGI